MHCNLRRATVRSHVARWSCKFQVLQLPSFLCKVGIGWWEGGAGGALRQGLAVLTASWCPVGICSEMRAVFLEQFSITRNRAWNASNSSGMKHSWPFAQDSHPILPALLTQEKFQETSPTCGALFVLTWHETKPHAHLFRAGLVISQLIRMIVTLWDEGEKRKQNCCWSNIKFTKHVPGSHSLQ